MTCPQCGSQTQSDQKFCRSCGASLQMTTQPLAELTAPSDLERTSGLTSRREYHRAKNLMLWGFITMFLGIVIGVVGKKLVHEDIVTVVGIVTSLAGMFLVVYPYLSPPPRKRKDRSAPAVVTGSRSTEYLPQGSSVEYVPSITERTTNLLKEPMKRPRLKESEDSEIESGQEEGKP